MDQETGSVSDQGGGDDWEAGVARLLCGDRLQSAVPAFSTRVPAGYRERTSLRQAALDLAELDALEAGAHGSDQPDRTRAPGGAASPEARYALGEEGCPPVLRLRRYGFSGVELSDFLPVIESFGLRVLEAVPTVLAPASAGGRSVHLDDFGLRPDLVSGPQRSDAIDFAPRLLAALEAVDRHACEVDALNGLVVNAGLDWRRVALLRAYQHYAVQARGGAGDDLEGPLVAHPAVSASLVHYFEARFAAADPAASLARRQEILRELEEVDDIEQDLILRSYLDLVDATSRTTFYLPDSPDGQHRIGLKFDSRRLACLRPPRPAIETFVYSPRAEGIHLRAGLVARGGIRWSDRAGDLRTEILGLAQAQVKKNSIIVPTGAKGGFACRETSPSPDHVRDAYRLFVATLLDLSDNVIGGEIVRPREVLAADGDDPYLVVAPDRGTATFSDLANQLSAERGFWLGDAFASGGSHGYDHKAMGITARGAWVAVERHFAELGIDVAREPIRVVGVGDMSGDVFGNGMLQSSAIKLVAAFDHRHIFIDPDPDPAVSFAERSRLARMVSSTWADYDRSLLSAGGGVWTRHDKTIHLSRAARLALGVKAEALSAHETVKAILGSPVDLLWFGGIGTYVKGPDEADEKVGDHANDPVRITSDQLRARVVAEGANLGITQVARIRYSRRGGRINADFIDNAAGVATSDREVNIKILLALAIDQGRLQVGQRDEVLHGVESEVASAVLRQVARSVATVGRALGSSADHLEAYQALIAYLEGNGFMDRAVESLPDATELARRRSAGAGLIRPELAVLMAYANSSLASAIEASELVGDPTVLRAVKGYFAGAALQPFSDLVASHRLYPQLAATELAGAIVSQMGIVWARETSFETGRSMPEVASAFWAAREVLCAGEFCDALHSGRFEVHPDAEQAAHSAVAAALDELACRYLRRSLALWPGQLVAEARREQLVAGVAGLSAAEVLKVSGEQTSGIRPTPADDLIQAGLPPRLAEQVDSITTISATAEAASLAATLDWPVLGVLEALSLVESSAGLTRLAGVLSAPRGGRLTRWHARSLSRQLADWRARAVTEALSVAPTRDVKAAVSSWAAAHSQSLARCVELVGYFDPASPDALSVAALAVGCLWEA